MEKWVNEWIKYFIIDHLSELKCLDTVQNYTPSKKHLSMYIYIYMEKIYEIYF